MSSSLENATLAPCVAVVGPANSGKTTLLHFLDRALTSNPARPLTYVVKGSPDGTGRYLLYRSKEERESLKERVKGKWSEPTVDTICEWIRNARRYLDIVLLDFGGKRTPEVLEENLRMMGECTHAIVLARPFTDPQEEAAKGMEAWRTDCRKAGLTELATIDSLWLEGEPHWRDEGGTLRAAIRADKEKPTDTLNNEVIAALASRLVNLRQPGRFPAYIDLWRVDGWSVGDPYSQMSGLVPMLERMARASGTVPLGGKTALFAFLLAMHGALRANPAAEILIFNPTTSRGLVRVPSLTGKRHELFPYGELKVVLEERGDGLELDIRIISEDKFLSESAAEYLAHAPLPEGGLAGVKRVSITGAGPNWLYAAYSRWLAENGVGEIAILDKSSNLYIRVHPLVDAGKLP